SLVRTRLYLSGRSVNSGRQDERERIDRHHVGYETGGGVVSKACLFANPGSGRHGSAWISNERLEVEHFLNVWHEHELDTAIGFAPLVGAVVSYRIRIPVTGAVQLSRVQPTATLLAFHRAHEIHQNLTAAHGR